jgi:hypothetical protein
VVHDRSGIHRHDTGRKKDLYQRSHEHDTGYEPAAGLVSECATGRPLGPMELRLVVGWGEAARYWPKGSVRQRFRGDTRGVGSYFQVLTSAGMSAEGKSHFSRAESGNSRTT